MKQKILINDDWWAIWSVVAARDGGWLVTGPNYFWVHYIPEETGPPHVVPCEDDEWKKLPGNMQLISENPDIYFAPMKLLEQL